MMPRVERGDASVTRALAPLRKAIVREIRITCNPCSRAVSEGEVQRSNMSKACGSEEEARQTQEHYRQNKGGTRSYVEKISADQWFVYREGDHKALKSVDYSPAKLEPILAAAAAADGSAEAPFVQPDTLTGVAAFHRLVRAPVLTAPVLPPADRCALRVSLLEEEVTELADAIRENDFVEVADALADIQVNVQWEIDSPNTRAIYKQLRRDDPSPVRPERRRP